MIICYESNSSRTILNKQFEERERGEREEEKNSDHQFVS